MSERGLDVGGIWPWFFVLGNGMAVPAQFCQGQQANQTGPDRAKWHPALLAERVLESFETEPTFNLT
jgi:hypothetical protein